jgi:hypothetical protein
MGSTGANSVQDASRELQTRTKDGKKKQARRDSGVPGADAGQPEMNSQLASAEISKNSRPRARPLNRARRQTLSSSDPSIQPQNPSQVQATTASDAAACDTMDSSPASPPVERATSEGPCEDSARLSRKRRTTTSRSELNYADKRQKTSDQLQDATEATSRSPDADAVRRCKCVQMRSGPL